MWYYILKRHQSICLYYSTYLGFCQEQKKRDSRLCDELSQEGVLAYATTRNENTSVLLQM